VATSCGSLKVVKGISFQEGQVVEQTQDRILTLLMLILRRSEATINPFRSVKRSILSFCVGTFLYNSTLFLLTSKLVHIYAHVNFFFFQHVMSTRNGIPNKRKPETKRIKHTLSWGTIPSRYLCRKQHLVR